MRNQLSVFMLPIINFLLIPSCSSKNKVVVLIPGGDNNKPDGEIVYKAADPKMNAHAKQILHKAFTQIESGFFHEELKPAGFMCGVNLWNQIKHNSKQNDTIGIPLTFMMPETNTAGKVSMVQMYGRMVKKDNEYPVFFQYLSRHLGVVGAFTFRKLNDNEKDIYWTFNSWDIQEPVFMMEVNEKLLLVDLLFLDNKWQLFYMDDFTNIIERWKSSSDIERRQDKISDLTEDGNISEAELEAYSNVKEVEKTYGINHEKYAAALFNLGIVYMHKPDDEKAIKYLKRAEQVATEVLGKESGLMAFILASLGGIYVTKEEYPEADSLLSESLIIARKVFGEKHQIMGLIYSNLSRLYTNSGDFEKALETHKKSIEMTISVYGASSLNTAIVYNNLAEYYFDVKIYISADSIYRKALAIVLKTKDEEHPLANGIQGNIGRNLVYLEKYSEAEPILLKSLEYKEKRFGRDHETLLETLEALELLYLKTGNKEREALYKKWRKEINK